jgi:hypothetical protein
VPDNTSNITFDTLSRRRRQYRDAPSYIGIVFNGSPLITGEAGSGESEIRRWILEKDWLVALVALPEQMFYNTRLISGFSPPIKQRNRSARSCFPKWGMAIMNPLPLPSRTYS